MALINERNDAVMSEEARSIGTSRVFDAPRELVFDLWTKPEHIHRWWGPRGFTTTTKQMDVRPGGRWLFTMHGADGTDYPNEITYSEVVRPQRLVYRHGPVPLFDVTVTFDDEGGRTKVTMRLVLESAEVRNQVVEEYGAIEGMQQTFDRLGEQIANASAFTISRVFDAPRQLMFEAWTERDHLARWFGPKGAEIFHCTNDLRPGGVMHYAMRTANGQELWGKWVYREIIPPQRLVFVASFSDPQQNITHSPFPGEWPLETLSTITFVDEGGRTRIELQWAPINATDAERQAFEAGHASMNMGWTGTFEQLGEYLKTLQ